MPQNKIQQSYKEKYWNTLIQLDNAEDKIKFQELCKDVGASPSKVIGNMIHSFVLKIEKKVMHE